MSIKTNENKFIYMTEYIRN